MATVWIVLAIEMLAALVVASAATWLVYRHVAARGAGSGVPVPRRTERVGRRSPAGSL